MSPSRRRRGRGPLVTVVVVALLLAVVDRVAVRIAQGQVAAEVQSSQGLADRPQVAIGGFPFLTQVARGRYRQVTMTIDGLQRNGLRLDRIHIVAEGVRVDSGDLIGGTVGTVPIDHARGAVLVTYPDLDAYLAQRVDVPEVTVRRDGDRLKVTGGLTLPVLDRPLSLSADASVHIAGENVTLLPDAVTAVTGFLPGFAQSAAREALTVRFAVKGLPLGVHLGAARLTDEGIEFTATGDGLTLSRP